MGQVGSLLDGSQGVDDHHDQPELPLLLQFAVLLLHLLKLHEDLLVVLLLLLHATRYETGNKQIQK